MPHQQRSLPLLTMRVLLDTNAICDFDRRGALGTTAVHAMREMVKHRKIDVLFTIFQLTELAGMHADPKHAKYIREILRLSGGRILQAYVHRAADEMRFGRKLTRSESLYKPHETRDLLAKIFDRKLAADEQVHIAKVKEAFRKQEMDARAALQNLPDVRADWPRWRARWDANRDAVVAESVPDAIDFVLSLTPEMKARGASYDRSKSFDFKRLPSVWRAQAFHFARIRLLLDGRLSFRESDVIDSEHFTDAAYADVFVTSDRALTRIAAQTGVTEGRIVSFEEWARELGPPAR
jgi:hypothetical protein